MMKKLLLAAAVACLHVFSLTAQTIFTYGDKSVDKDEFLRIYSKNNTDASAYTRQSVEEYVNLYALFKMKVAEAERMRMDTVPAIKAELNSHRSQLAKNYLVDQSINDKLLEEAYARSGEEVEIAHILISQKGRDTTAAFNKINEVYSSLQSGMSFEEAALKYSNDKGSAEQGGKVGYIGVLTSLYPIENAAYTTPVGQYSKPFKSQLGYHILKVLNKRPSMGKIQVAQILIAPESKNDPSSVEAARNKAGELVSSLRKGADFEKAVKEVSQDKFSINNNGLLPAFGVGEMDPAFEAAAFALGKPGDISDPVKTDYGFHIIKLISKIKNPSFEAAKEDLSKKIQNDNRVALSEQAFKEKQLQALGFRLENNNLDALAKAIGSDTASIATVTPEKYSAYTQPLFHLNNKVYSQQDFLQFLINVTGGKLYGRKEQSVREIFNTYKDKVTQDVQMEELEKNNATFRNTVQEYQEGILLFALTEQNIWSKGIDDAAGLNQYYEQHKSKYTRSAGFEGYLFESRYENYMKDFIDLINKGTPAEDAINEVNINKGDEMLIVSKGGTFELRDFDVPVEAAPEGKISKMYTHNNGVFFAFIPEKNFADGSIKPFEDAKGMVVTDYQQQLEQEWVEELKKKYPLKINQKVVKSIIKK